MKTHPHIPTRLFPIFPSLPTSVPRSRTSGLIDDNNTAEEIAFSGRGLGFVEVRSGSNVIVFIGVGGGGVWVGVDIVRVAAGSVPGLSSSGVLTDEVFLVFLV